MTITGKIIGSFLGIILLFVVALSSFFLFHTSSIEEYRRISHTLAVENMLTTRVHELMESYTQLAVEQSSADRLAEYTAQRGELLATFDELDTLVGFDGEVAYRGLKNVITGIVSDLEKGHEAILRGDVVSSASHYTDAVNKKTFVESNVTTLLLSEIQHLSTLEAAINERYKTELLMIIGWTLLILLLSTIYAILFSRNITNPIKLLSGITERTARGDLSSEIPESLLTHHDEVGKLAQSFDTMLKNLNSKISEIERTDKIILETQRDLKERNVELEKFNNIMINRELKMVELKDTIKKMEEKIAKHESGNT